MEITQKIKGLVEKALTDLNISHDVTIHLEHPGELVHGDFATNIAMVLAQKEGKNPRELAEQIVETICEYNHDDIDTVEVAGPGFINFKLSGNFFGQEIKKILEQGGDYGKNDRLKGQKIITEFTDPNPFKLFHIGHLMSNTIGESLTRLFQFSGAEVKWANYQGDVGMHVAKAIWGMQELGGIDEIKQANLKDQVAFMGRAYAHGAKTYKDGIAVEIMQQLNKAIYDRSDENVNALYDWGRQVSLDYFEIQYRRLGTYHNPENNKSFHYYFFESEVGSVGKEKVLEFLKKGVFEESDGAVIFPGEKYRLHNRVFINSLGLPTYEAKELGLSKIKYDTYPYDQSFIITANEIDEYFKVLLKAMSFVFPELAEKTNHISHGMLKLTTGKMSSRTGDVIVAEELLDGIEELAREKTIDRETTSETVSQIAVAAIKFAILKQDTGKDIIFDPEQSLSFEGDSGPYLQYTYARCRSILEKASIQNLEPVTQKPEQWETTNLEKYLYRFPGVFDRASQDYAPHVVANYAIELARVFNSWYGQGKIVDTENSDSGYKLALTQATAQIIHNALWLLGIEAPEQM